MPFSARSCDFNFPGRQHNSVMVWPLFHKLSHLNCKTLSWSWSIFHKVLQHFLTIGTAIALIIFYLCFCQTISLKTFVLSFYLLNMKFVELIIPEMWICKVGPLLGRSTSQTKLLSLITCKCWSNSHGKSATEFGIARALTPVWLFLALTITLGHTILEDLLKTQIDCF